jgi:hypothetical protein
MRTDTAGHAMCPYCNPATGGIHERGCPNSDTATVSGFTDHCTMNVRCSECQFFRQSCDGRRDNNTRDSSDRK